MTVEDYYRRVTDVILDLTEVERADLEGKRRTTEVVDARWMIVKLLREAGYYPTQIAPVMKMTVRQVQSIISTFDIRLRYSDLIFRSNYEAASKILRSN